mgnify:CR=1 FL=1
MLNKEFIRKKYLKKRKKNFFKINNKFFNPLIKLLKKKKLKKTNIALYYPSSDELDILQILKLNFFKKKKFLLPIIEDNNKMNFCKWETNDILFVNKFGILEPFKTKPIVPNIMLIPMLAFDENKNRLGYGKGFYDKFLRKCAQNGKKIITVGVAFSFQKYHNLPTDDKDVKLNFIITEKGLV